jgi:predicted anti-sigma-YlaC factor YlaD
MTVTRMLKRIFSRHYVDCRETRVSGSDYLEDDLSPRKRSAIRAHLDRCGPCRAFIEGLSSTIGVLARLPRTAPPPAFKQGILDRARAADRGH